MGKLFQDLVDNELLLDWANTLDWLFDDNRFSTDKGWNSGYVSQFTKRIKRFDGLSDKNGSFLVGKAEDLGFPQRIGKERRKPKVVMIKGESIARDYVRHIRNGIAHGRSRIIRDSDELHIEILDFGKDGDAQKKNQTAYIFIPVSYITKSMQVYNEIERSIAHTTEKDRKTRNAKGSR